MEIQDPHLPISIFLHRKSRKVGKILLFLPVLPVCLYHSRLLFHQTLIFAFQDLLVEAFFVAQSLHQLF